MSDCLPGCRCKCGDVLDNDRHDPLLAYGPVFHRFEAKTHAPHCPNAEPPKPVQERCAVGGCTRTPDPDERYCTPHQTPTKPSAEPPHDVASDCLPECHKSEVIGGVVHDGDHSPDCPKSDQDVASEPDFEAAERLLGDLTIADYLTRNDSCRDYCSGCGVMITNRFDILGEPCEPPTVHKKTCKNVVIPVIKKAYLALRAENAALKAEAALKGSAMENLAKVLTKTEAERDEARAEAARLKAAETRLLASESELEHEVQRALELIPEEFVRNDEWWKGVGRLAEAFQKLREERDAAVARVRGLEDAICHQEACTLIEDRIGPVFREAQDIRRRRSQARRREEKGGE